MDPIEVRSLDPHEYPSWDALVQQSSYGTIFHMSHWIITAGQEANIKTELLGAFLKDRLVGGCAIHFDKIAGIYPTVTTELPLTPYGGIIIGPHDSTKNQVKEKYEWSITNAILFWILNQNPAFISLTLSPNVIDVRPYTWQNWKEIIHYCYIFSISDPLMDNISKKVRWSINRAKKSAIVAKQKWDEDIYWDLTLKTYQKQGKEPPVTKKLLISLINNIQDHKCGEMWIAETPSGDAASAEIVIWDQQMAYRWSAASSEQYKNTGATSFLLFEIMTRLQEKGYSKFNLMAANTPHLAKFISGFNPTLVPYYSVQKARGMFRIFNLLRSIY
jgi:hypothetical protein